MKTQDTIIAHPINSDQFAALKAVMKALKIQFEVRKEKPYNPEFVAKIQESRDQYKRGEYAVIKTEDLWK